MADSAEHGYVDLDAAHPIWDRCFMVAPLVVVGTHDEDGSPDFAPKHMVAPLSWAEHYGFVCTPEHATYRNVERNGWFTVSFPRPSQVVLASLASAPRCEDSHKHGLDALATVPARRVPGELLADAYLHLECERDRVVDGLGSNSLVVGRIVAARVAEDCLRGPDREDQQLIADAPLLAYLHPGRYARIGESYSFPYHAGWSR